MVGLVDAAVAGSDADVAAVIDTVGYDMHQGVYQVAKQVLGQEVLLVAG